MTTEKGEPYYKVIELIELLQRNAQPDDVVMLNQFKFEPLMESMSSRFKGSIVRENNQQLGRHVAILT
jgi:hypothetical protein